MLSIVVISITQYISYSAIILHIFNLDQNDLKVIVSLSRRVKIDDLSKTSETNFILKKLLKIRLVFCYYSLL